MTESQIQKEIIQFLKEHKIFHFRVNADATTVGIPDIVACYKGVFLGIEVKTPTGVATKMQEKVREEIYNNQGWHVYARSVDDVRKVMFLINKYGTFGEYKWN